MKIYPIVQTSFEADAMADDSTNLQPVCAGCGLMRTPQGDWVPISGIIQTSPNAPITHTLCPDCMRKLYPNLREGITYEDS